MMQGGIESTNATKGLKNATMIERTAAVAIVTTEAFFVIATQPTDSP